MAECTQCRAPMAAGSPYCPRCGASQAATGTSAVVILVRALLICFVGLPLAAGAGCATCIGVYAAVGDHDGFTMGIPAAAIVTIAVLIGIVKLVGMIGRKS